jgi:large subunit ribosomal protein L3
MGFYPRKRKGRLLPEVRFWPFSSEPGLLGFVAYKAGMVHTIVEGDVPNTPDYGKPLMKAATVVSAPPLLVVAIRAYVQTPRGLRCLGEVWAQELPKHLSRKVRINVQKASNHMPELESRLADIAQVRVLVASFPHQAGLSQKKPFLVELGVGGRPEEALAYARQLLGKAVSITEVFKPGEYVDVIGVTKGKGVQGPVKRFGIRRKEHKARKSVRAVGSIGPIRPANVMFTVPRAGQMGFHQRTEFNKRLLSLDAAPDDKLVPPGGFPHFGVLKAGYALIEGSLPGPAKRVLVLRKAARMPAQPSAPKLLTVVART